eukprot:scaffold24406_cov35-Cyclotella_meneghiniana.AAC.2
MIGGERDVAIRPAEEIQPPFGSMPRFLRIQRPICAVILMTTASSDRSENGDGALKKDGRRWQARSVLTEIDGRGQIARLSEFFWTRD